MTMIGYRIDQIKGLFFDSAKVQAATSRAERSVLSRFGAFVRQASPLEHPQAEEGRRSRGSRPAATRAS